MRVHRFRLFVRLLAAAALAGGCNSSPAPDPSFSLLAVGDQGAPPADAEDYTRMLAVADAMAKQDIAQPIDAVVLLGDNFYPGGLLRNELIERIRVNVARPFCRFVIAGPRFGELKSTCESAGDSSHPVPLYAVLGNHDYDHEESPDLQRHTVSEFVANWQMPAGLAAAHQVADDVSLILFDSEALLAGADAAPLVAAMRESPGPWRIVATHRPIATLEAPESVAYLGAVRQAIAAAGVDVHLFLAGHEHRLAILGMTPPDPPLHAISGGGSDRRKNRFVEPHTLTEFSQHGFARVDRIGDGDEARLVVSLFGVHRYAWMRPLEGRRLLGRWSVDIAGSVTPGGG